MSHRVTALKNHVFLSGGSVFATAVNLQVFANDKTNGLRVTSLQANAWVGFDQGLYLNPPFGGEEIFAPDFEVKVEITNPLTPTIEVNPFRADTPNIDLQRILREQHNLTQAGDSTFHWGVLTEISATPLYSLGAAGRFYHDTLGIIKARYCRFVDFNPTVARAVPVGVRLPITQPWTVTNQLELSSADAVLGVALPYNDEVNIGAWYGWVVTEGFLPTELLVTLTNLPTQFGTEYGWSVTGEVQQGLDAASVGRRWIVSNNLRLTSGAFFVDVDASSLGKVNGLVTAKMTPLVSDLETLTSDLAEITQTVAGHTQQLAAVGVRLDQLQNQLNTDIQSLSNAISAIRQLMPDGNFKNYVDVSIAALRGYVINQDSIITSLATAALNRANEAYLLADSISYSGVQTQINALNQSLGGLTTRLAGFDPVIDSNTLTAGQILISTDAGLTPGGVQKYTFNPYDFTHQYMLDVDWTTPPTDGQVLIWNAAGSKFIPGTPAGSGSGDVVGPAASTDTHIARFDGVTGKLIQDSVVTVGDGGSVQTVLGPTGDAVLGFNGFQIQSEAASSGFRVRAHGNATNNAGVNAFFRLRGTIAAPTLVMAGDTLGSCIFRGWNGTSIVNGCYASFGGVATQNANLGGSAIYFSTVPNGGGNANLTERMRIDQDGFVKAHVGVQVPAEAYGVGWSGDLSVPTKADLYTKIESMAGGGGGTPIEIDLGSYSQGFSNSTGAQASKANILKTLQATTVHGVFPRFISKVVGATYQCTIATLTTANGFTIDTVLGTSDVYTATTVDQEWAELVFSTPVTIPANTRFALIVSRTGVAGTTVLTLSAASTGEVTYSGAGFMDTAVTNLGFASYTAANPPVSGTAASTSGGTNCYAIGVRFSH